MDNIETINCKEVDDWRAKHPGNVSVRVKYSDAVVILTFEDIDPNNPETKHLLGTFPMPNSFGDETWWDRDGTKHYRINPRCFSSRQRFSW